MAFTVRAMINLEKTPNDLRERKRRLTLDRIAEVGLKLFVEKGYEATTLDAIAAASGISRRTFFYYLEVEGRCLAGAREWQLPAGSASHLFEAIAQAIAAQRCSEDFPDPGVDVSDPGVHHRGSHPAIHRAAQAAQRGRFSFRWKRSWQRPCTKCGQDQSKRPALRPWPP